MRRKKSGRLHSSTPLDLDLFKGGLNLQHLVVKLCLGRRKWVVFDLLLTPTLLHILSSIPWSIIGNSISRIRSDFKDSFIMCENISHVFQFQPAMVVMPPASTALAHASYPDSRPGRNSRNTVDPLIKTC